MKSILVKNQKKEFTARTKDISVNGNAQEIVCTVKYDDECGNGHNTFSMTVWAGSEKNGWGGADMDSIKKYFPGLAKYIKWHLTSSNGPMHYIANTMYWVRNQNLKYAQSCAIWENAKLSEMTEKALAYRLPALMDEFKKDMEEIGFIF